jgi:YfiH family protein
MPCVLADQTRLRAADLIVPDWPLPPGVRAFSTTRAGGVSLPPFATLNLGDHVGDQPAAVRENRQRLSQWLPAPPVWLTQVHGTRVLEITSDQSASAPPPAADASWTEGSDIVCAIMTADCLPVLFARLDGQRVAAAHAGWRGLAAGVLESTLTAMGCDGRDVTVWLGPAIGPTAFEVGDEVRATFVAHDAAAAADFSAGTAGKWWADIYALARRRLLAAGVGDIHGGRCCTHSDSARFFSYRRDGQTGRMASLIWRERDAEAGTGFGHNAASRSLGSTG